MQTLSAMNQWFGLAISYAFIFGVIGIAQILLRRRLLTAAATRKVVHIGVAHWWIIAMLFIDDLAVALIGPVSFIVINWISYRRHIFRAMEHEETRRNLGTIYFPIALTILVLLTWSGLFPRWFGLVAILVLGWGDGVASLFGEHFGPRRRALQFSVPGGRKSVIGTAGMFFATAAVVALLLVAFPGLNLLPTEAEAGLLANGTLSTAIAGNAPASWVAQPTDSAVLVALSRLDGIVRVAVERVARLGENAAAAAGPAVRAVSARTVAAVSPSAWRVAPTTILAIALLIAAAATAVELLTPWGLDNITIPLAVFALLIVLTALPAVWVVRLAWALGLNLLVAIVAYLKRSVTATGAIAGASVGLAIYLAGGGFFWSILMAFFISSSVLSRLRRRDRTGIAGGAAHNRGAAANAVEGATTAHNTGDTDVRTELAHLHAKGSRRDAIQVLANGGLAALTAAGYALTGRPIFMLGFAIAIAAANADTWASEIGVFSRRKPVSILTFRAIPRGTSGGISALGLIASAAGAFFIGLWFAVGYVTTRGWQPSEVLPMVAAITGGGFLGSLIDSLLGATVQAQYWDHVREVYTERRHDAAGAAHRLVRGFHVFTNDAVNAISGVASMALLFTIVT